MCVCVTPLFNCYEQQCAKTLQAREYVCDPESETVKAHAAVPGTSCMAYYPQVNTNHC
jgi:hypothetical protein